VDPWNLGMIVVYDHVVWKMSNLGRLTPLEAQTPPVYRISTLERKKERT